jgi:hypothetical protein
MAEGGGAIYVGSMTDGDLKPTPPPSLEDVQRSWNDLTLRLAQLEADRGILQSEVKALRLLIDRIIAHRLKSHGELVLLLTSLVSRLPLNDVGGFVTKLVEHHSNTSQFLGALAKGTQEADMPDQTILKTMDQTRRDLGAALKPVVDELISLNPPIELGVLDGLLKDPESFFSPGVARARRCFAKGQVPKERVLRQFGPEALALFHDMTTDPKLNPRPKQEEILLGFRPDFDALLPQLPQIPEDKRKELVALHTSVQQSKTPCEVARRQKEAFARLSFLVELLHYYEHQGTEAVDVIFAQRLPALIEQIATPPTGERIDEKMLILAEGLMAHVLNPDYRHMIINNLGKGGGTATTVRFVLKLRSEKVAELDHVLAEFVKHLLTIHQPVPEPAPIAAILKLIKPDLQRIIVKSILRSDRLKKEEAEVLGKGLATELGLAGLEQQMKAEETVPPEVERQLAWNRVKDLIARRSETNVIAKAIRDRLHERYDSDEIKQSWIVLTEADPISLIRVFCQLPYRSDGTTDSIARPVMETYVTRLTHEKYAATYHKVVNSLRNMFRAKADSPTLLNFMALVRWVDAEAAHKLAVDIGMPVAAS